jgi:hypothetical protein
MKVIPETSHAHKVGYLQFYYYYWVDTSAGGRLVPEGIIHPVIFFLKLTLFIRYIKVCNLQFLKNLRWCDTLQVKFVLLV